MKTKYILLFILAITFVSCGEDRRKEYAPRINANKWIVEVMRDNYYWHEDIPEDNKLNFYSVPSIFFPTLLSSKDGKSGSRYSTMEDLSEVETTTTRSTEEVTYGMELSFITDKNKTKTYLARVLYVLEDSPAKEAGLKRGDWIFSVDGAAINANNTKKLITGSNITVEVGTIDEEMLPVTKEPVEIPAARSMLNNPVFYHNTYQRGSKKIGYLVYNSFVSGEDNDTRYLEELSNISNEFKTENVTEVVLDLRYNLGGELNRPVPLLCSMFAPEAVMGSLMGTVKYNEFNQDKNWTLSFLEEHLNGGSNLNLSNIYILTGSYTASASEAVINFLNPYMKVTLIGAKTVGKNVGSQEFTNTEEFPQIILQPIVCQIFNSEEKSDYASGFTPEYLIDESKQDMKELGDPEELLLATALSIIDGTYTESETPETRSAFDTYRSTLERKSQTLKVEN
ncbi:S41 family peptidase [Bacteroides sp. 519]|uniref:S41 family peptidase n=1 Tax=Bacteroides sp. 519 TaxID=2302937 RepID=UPI0013CF6273|nr:S41 family peptidase [Bacteroides sp. 519]NDV58319.1 peptidase S41 [Bacteroides sp. 519]